MSGWEEGRYAERAQKLLYVMMRGFREQALFGGYCVSGLDVPLRKRCIDPLFQKISTVSVSARSLRVREDRGSLIVHVERLEESIKQQNRGRIRLWRFKSCRLKLLSIAPVFALAWAKCPEKLLPLLAHTRSGYWKTILINVGRVTP